MAFSKNHLYNPNDQFIAGYAHAFGHAARVLIIKQLISMGPSCVQVIAQDHPIHKETLSDHLKILRIFELVECEEKYPFTFYMVHVENLRRALKMLMDYIDLISDGLK